MSKVYNLKREVEKPPRLTGGHRLCAGCGAGVVVAGVLRALNKEDRAVVVNATGCLEDLYLHVSLYCLYGQFYSLRF